MEKRKTKMGTCFKATKNRSQEESRHRGYLCNDCHKSQSKQILRSWSKSSILDPEPEYGNAKELCTETRNHKPILHFQPTSVAIKGVSFKRNCGAASVAVLQDNLVLSTGLIMWIGHRKEIRKLTFRALALRRSEGLTVETSASESLYGSQFT